MQSLGAGTERWIGLSRPVGSPLTITSFEWITGEKVTYQNFYPLDEPEAYCARMWADGLWADHSCDLAYPIVCERE